MSSQNVTVPTSNRNNLLSWIGSIGTIIDAGNDAVFVDENGMPTPVAKIHADTDGTVVFVDTNSNVASLLIAGGGFHDVGGIFKIRSSGTTASLNLMVKAV